jgi:hypothetical protein
VADDPAAQYGGWSVLVHGADSVRVRQQARQVVVSSQDGRLLVFDAVSGRVGARFAAGTSPIVRAARV